MIYDIIIIGAGIAGLYAAYKIKKERPDSKILILEAESQIGGRAIMHNFHGIQVTTGAGVGRKKKDRLLIALLNELHIKYNEFDTHPRFSTTIEPKCSIKKTFLELRSKYNPKLHSSFTFRKFASSILGKNSYDHFVTCSGYSDYEEENAYDTLYNYGFDDNYQKWTALGLSWNNLIQTLSDKIGKRNILCNTRVSKLEPLENGIVNVFVKGGTIYECKKAIVATTIDCLRDILPGSSSKTSPYRHIHSQPFIRIYGKFRGDTSIMAMKRVCSSTIVVPGPLHKLIPMDVERGIYMIAYTDNKGVSLLEKFSENTPRNREALCRIMEIALGIPQDTLELSDILSFYWKEGTHFYDKLPLKYNNREEFIQDIQNPHSNILVIGEMASMKKGWVEGALESVESVITKVFET